MENIIKKAIEGGWNPRPEKVLPTLMAIYPSDYDGEFAMFSTAFKEKGKANGRTFSLYLTQIVSDSSFWQALGKSCGWYAKDTNIYHDNPAQWLVESLRFHEINLTQSWEKAVEWLENLITNKK